MARAIDADALQELCDRRIQDTWNSGTAPVSWAHAYADFKDDIDSMPTLTPPNEPLTLEELREMKGQPVWTVTTGLDGSGRWELVCDVDYEDVLEMASCVDGFYAIEMDTYGSTWTAYRRPPEGEV